MQTSGKHVARTRSYNDGDAPETMADRSPCPGLNRGSWRSTALTSSVSNRRIMQSYPGTGPALPPLSPGLSISFHSGGELPPETRAFQLE